MRYREILEAIDNDDDMFAGPGDFSNNLKSSIQQETDPYRRLVVKVREISKQLLGVSARVSMSPAAVGRPVQKLGRATFLFGKFPQGSPESLELVRRMQEALTDLGLDTKVTNSGWLSVKVPAPFASLDENNDDELFGSAPSAATLTQSIARAIVRSDKSARLITSTFMVGFALGKTPGGEPLLHYWKSLGKDKQDAMLDGINDAVYDLIANKVTEEDDDNDMFGTRPIPIHWNPELLADLLEQGQKVLMYRGIVSAPDILVSVFRTLKQQGDWMARRQSPPGAGYFSNGTFQLDPNKYMLLKVDDAHMLISNLDWKEYRGKNLSENDESDDELFGDGQQKAFVVTAPDDEILGMFDDIREAIAHAKKQVPIYLEDGYGDDDLITVYKQNRGEESGVPVAHFPITDDPIDENDESDDDLFGGNRLSTTLADKFEFPESGDLGYAMGGGGIGYGNGNSTDGLVIVSRGNNQIAFIPDFTYFDDNPTQEDLESLFHDEDTEQFPLSLQNVQKFLTLDESTDVANQDWFRKELQTFIGNR